MSEIPTAEEFFREKIRKDYQIPEEFSLANMDFLNAEKAMRWAHEYSLLKSKHHVQEALKKASEEAVTFIPSHPHLHNVNAINKNSILNAYPDENIK